MHLNVSTIPDTLRVGTLGDERGMVRLAILDRAIHGSICDERGQTKLSLEAQPAHLSVMMFRDQAASLARDLLGALTPDERAEILGAIPC